MSILSFLSSLAPDDPQHNRLIATLPRTALERIAPQLHRLTFATGDVLFDAGDALDAVYFPAGLVVSFDQVLGDLVSEFNATPAVALAGSEGFIGVEVFLGGNTAVNRATARMDGAAYRMEAQALREEFARGGALQRALLRYADALFAQVSHTAACERLHSTAQRLVRWLLVSDDRAAGKNLMWTQEALAGVIGVRRESVSLAAGKLQEDGLINYHRGES